MNEIKTMYRALDKKKIFEEQTKLINKINTNLGTEVYDSFIPFYKELATISQIFSESIHPKERLKLEDEFLKRHTMLSESKELAPIDNIVYKTFVNKFNEKYSCLLSEQKDLLTKYVGSFADDGLELKIYLNEQLSQLKARINSAIETPEIKTDSRMLEKTQKLLGIISDFKSQKEISESMLENLLRIQQFVHEVEKND